MNTYLFNHSKTKFGDNFTSTHTRIGDKDLNIYGGNYCIEDKDQFMKLYYKEIVENNSDEYLTEKQDKNGVIAVDLDFRYCHDVTIRQHNKCMEDIIMSVTEPLKEFYKFKNEDEFDVYVLEKPNVNVLEDGSLTKDGIHFIIGLNMKYEYRELYRKSIINWLKENVDLPLINDWEDVVDKGVIMCSNNWQMFGSKKPNNQKYNLSRAYKFQYDSSDKQFSWNNVSKDMTYDLFNSLSIQNLDRPNIEILQNKQTRITCSSPISVVEIDTFENKSIQLIDTDIYYKYLNCIGNSMCSRGQYNETYKISQILKNENLDIKYIKYWIHRYAYPDSKKYTYAIDNYDKYIKFSPLSVENRLTIKSLKFLARKYNPELYSIYFKDDYEYRIKKEYTFADLYVNTQDEASSKELYYKFKKERIIYKNDNIYLYYNDEWNVMNDKGRMVKNDMEEFFIIYFRACLDIINEEEKKYINDEEKSVTVKKMRKYCLEVKQNLMRASGISNVFSLLLNKLSSVKTDIVFDTGSDNHFNIHFKNGVYDLKNKLFRSRVETDYVTKYLNYNYIKLEDIPKETQEDVFSFFKKIQPEENQRNFTLGYLAYCLTGDATKQIFKMNIGHTASNGKSTELSIHEKCFEIYTEKIDNRVLLLNFEKRHKHLINLIKNPVRLAYFEEMPKGKKLDVEFLKDFVDGKKISCEIMFGTKDNIFIQAKLMSVSNHDFQCDTDEGILRRGRVQKYESKFVNDIELVDEVNHHYKKIEGFENKFDDVVYKNAYFHLLLKHIDNLIVPKINQDEFKKTAEESDDILNNILERFEITNNENDVISKREIEYHFGKDKFNDYKTKLQSKGCKYDSQTNCKFDEKWSKGQFTGLKTIEMCNL